MANIIVTSDFERILSVSMNSGIPTSLSINSNDATVGILRIEKGPQGDQGIAGPIGPSGLRGIKGDTGDVGPSGEKGDKGDPGNFSQLIIGSGDGSTLISLTDDSQLLNFSGINIDFSFNDSTKTIAISGVDIDIFDCGTP